MDTSHQDCRRDLDLAAMGQPMVDVLRTQKHLSGCRKCKDYFNKRGAEGRRQNHGEVSMMERSFLDQYLEAALPTWPSEPEVPPKVGGNSLWRRRLLFPLGYFLGGSAAMLLYFLFFE